MNFKKFAVGTIPSCWEIKLIDEIKSKDKNAIAMGPFGSRIKSDSFVSSGVPIIRGNNLKKYSFDETDFVFVTEEKAQELKSSIVRKGDLVITHRGTLGQVGIIPENSKYNQYIVSQSGLKISCDLTLVRPEFLYYFLNSRVGQYLLLRNTSQVGVPSIAQPTTSIKQIPVPIPSLIEQNQIVKVLSSIDQKIELNNQMNETLEEMAQTLFKRWFVDFEFPNEEGQCYKSNGGEMIESELGMIPHGWEVKGLGELIAISSGKRPSKKSSEKNSEYKYPLIGASSIMGYVLEPLCDDKILVIGRVGTHGVVQRFFEPVWPSDNTLVIRTPYYEFINQILRKIDYSAINRGSTQPLITQTDIKNTKVIFPTVELLKIYEEKCSVIFNMFQHNQVENISLCNLRDTLLPKLMSGEIRVSDLEE